MSDVLIRVSGACGRMTLNRPHALNALTPEMVSLMKETMRAWASDPSVHFIVVDGAGDRGLCAGGDIRVLYNAVTSGDLNSATAFFWNEYRLNDSIARYPKPYVALMDGIVMGGGLGISAHGSHRVVTERSSLAMPETLIGFVPDVGGTYLLGTAPGEVGTYLGLTGNRVGAGDAIACNLADLMVPSSTLPALTEELERCSDAAAMQDCLQRYAVSASPGRTSVQRAWIDECFAADTMEKIFAALASHARPEAQSALSELMQRSPTSLKVTHRALRHAREVKDLASCLQQEYRIAHACVRGHDFMEGIRAAVIDKDRNPQWHPARLEDVTPLHVQHHFVEPPAGDLDLSPAVK